MLHYYLLLTDYICKDPVCFSVRSCSELPGENEFWENSFQHSKVVPEELLNKPNHCVISFFKTTGIKLPSSVFASEFEEDVGLLNKAAPVSGVFNFFALSVELCFTKRNFIS